MYLVAIGQPYCVTSYNEHELRSHGATHYGLTAHCG